MMVRSLHNVRAHRGTKHFINSTERVEKHTSLQFAGMLLVIFGMELAGGITGYVLQEDVEEILRSTVNNSMSKYSYNKEIAKTWNIMQHDVSIA
jgi:Na+/H+ antiporter NhaD/arsenite permease-like protein